MAAQQDAYYAAVDNSGSYGAVEKGYAASPYGYGPASDQTFASTAATGPLYVPRSRRAAAKLGRAELRARALFLEARYGAISAKMQTAGTLWGNCGVTVG